MTLPTLDRYSPAPHDEPMPRPYATLAPGQRLEVLVESTDGGRVLVTGTLRSVPEAAGGRAIRLLLVDAVARPVQK